MYAFSGDAKCLYTQPANYNNMTSSGRQGSETRQLRENIHPRPPVKAFESAHKNGELEILRMATHILEGILRYGFTRQERKFKVAMVKGASHELVRLVAERLNAGKLSDGANSHLMVEAAMVEASNKGLVWIIESRKQLPYPEGNPSQIARNVFTSLVCNGYSEKNPDGSVTTYTIEVHDMGRFMRFLRNKAKSGAFSEPQNFNSDLAPVLKEACAEGLIDLRKIFNVPNSSVA
jgi:hypothetical protein